MSEKRRQNIALLKERNEGFLAAQQEPDEEEIQRVEEHADTHDLSSDDHIRFLKNALKTATSDDVKQKIRDEIDATVKRNKEEKLRQKKELETIKAAGNVATIAAQTGQSVSDASVNSVRKIADFAGQAGNTVSALATPGGLFLPITLLLIFFFVLLPINGHTRAEWLWMALTGQAHIYDGAAASGDFGPSATNTPPVQGQPSQSTLPPFSAPARLYTPVPIITRQGGFIYG